MVTSEMDPGQGMELCGGCGEAQGKMFSSRRRERWSLTAKAAWHSASGPDPILLTPSGGVFCCSIIAAKDPAWRRPSLVWWCGGDPLGVVVSTSFILYRRWVTPRFFDDYKSVECGWVLRYCFVFAAVFEWSGVVSFEYSSSKAA